MTRIINIETEPLLLELGVCKKGYGCFESSWASPQSWSLPAVSSRVTAWGGHLQVQWLRGLGGAACDRKGRAFGGSGTLSLKSSLGHVLAASSWLGYFNLFEPHFSPLQSGIHNSLSFDGAVCIEYMRHVCQLPGTRSPQ